MLLCQRNRGQSGQGHFGQNQNWIVKIFHYSINIYIYTIVSNDRVSEIDFDHFDLDHNDHKKTHKMEYQNLEISTNYRIFAEKSKTCEQSYNA